MTDTVIGTGSYVTASSATGQSCRAGGISAMRICRGRRTTVKGAVAANGDVYVLCRAAHPVLVFDAEGRFVTSWGEGEFSSFVHGMTIDRAGKIWITDTGLHTVTQHEPDGTLLRTFGERHFAAPTWYGKPFNMPTGVAFASSGDIFVSDGYGNRRVHCFSADRVQHWWGSPATALVSSLWSTSSPQTPRTGCTSDRENHRIQIFATTGEVLAQWGGFTMPSDLAFGREPPMSPARTACRSGPGIAASSPTWSRRTILRRVQRSRHLAR